MHIILTGATGQCGGSVLQYCLSSPAITRISILSRRPVPLAEGQAKASVILHQDFTQYPQSVLDKLHGAVGCVWALGVSASDVSKEKYVEITHTYAIAAATAFSKLLDPFKFVFVSGEGADPTERTFMYFGKIKGRAEKDLHNLSTTYPSLRTFAVRPAFIVPEGEVIRKRRPSEYLTQVLDAPIMRRVYPSTVIGSKTLARVLVDLATGDGNSLPPGPNVTAEGRTLNNAALRKLAGL